MRPIYLIGFMGVGKSTIGKKLARRLSLKFIDLDALFEQRYKVNIAAFFEKYGEGLFRKFEYELLQSTYEMCDVVIATGGGTPCYQNAVSEMVKQGLVVFMRMPAKALGVRLMNAKRQRPLILGKSQEELCAFISTKLDERQVFYEQAHLVADALNFDIEKLLIEISYHPGGT